MGISHADRARFLLFLSLASNRAGPCYPHSEHPCVAHCGLIEEDGNMRIDRLAPIQSSGEGKRA